MPRTIYAAITISDDDARDNPELSDLATWIEAAGKGRFGGVTVWDSLADAQADAYDAEFQRAHDAAQNSEEAEAEREADRQIAERERGLDQILDERERTGL